MNWGTPFVIAFIVLLIASATELSMGAADAANGIAVYGFYALVIGIALQVASYLKYGEAGAIPVEAGAPEPVVMRPRTRLPRRTRLAAIATFTLILLTSVVIVYPVLSHPGPVSVEAGSSVSSSSSSGCSGPRNDGTVFISTSATVSIEICGQSFLVQAGPGGGLAYSYHSGLVSFTAPASADGSQFEFWYVTLGGNPSERVNNATLNLNLPALLNPQNSLIGLFYTAPPAPEQSTAVSPTSNLVGYWPLDEESGPSAFDASGAGNNGTLINSPTWQSGANCKFRGCLSFASASSQYVSTAFANTTLPITWNAWIYMNSYPSSCSDQMNVFFFQGAQIGVRCETGSPSTNTFMGATGLGLASGIMTGPALETNTWYMATFQINTAGTQAIACINAQCQTIYKGIALSALSGNFSIGEGVNAARTYFDGRIDDVRVYSSALSPSQISQIYTQIPPSTSSATMSTTSGIISSTSSTATTNPCRGNDGNIFVSTNINTTVSIDICDEQVPIPGGVGGGFHFSYHAGPITLVAPATMGGKAFEYWSVMLPSQQEQVRSNQLSLNIPAGNRSNNSILEAFYG